MKIIQLNIQGQYSGDFELLPFYIVEVFKVHCYVQA